tara:strand:- start:6 stop:260 length:255 start_codon:yes stop_codon:yes gene_type:complete
MVRNNMLDIKEANRVFFAVKGSLIPDEYTTDDIEAMYYSYVKRLWGNHEASNCDDRFEAEWYAKYEAPDADYDYPDFINGDYFD